MGLLADLGLKEEEEKRTGLFADLGIDAPVVQEEVVEEVVEQPQPAQQEAPVEQPQQPQTGLGTEAMTQALLDETSQPSTFDNVLTSMGGAFRDAPSTAVGIGENVMSMGSGILGQITGGIGGLANAPFRDASGNTQAGDVSEGIASAMTYQPRTQAGQGIQSDIGGIVESTRIPEAIEYTEKAMGDAVFDLTGSPELAALATAVPEATMMAMGFAGLNRIRGSKKITGLTDDNVKALNEKGLDVDTATPENISVLKAETAENLLAQQDRMQTFRDQGIEPTRAQVTRNADDFQLQEEMAKTDTAPRRALEQQERELSGQVDRRIQDIPEGELSAPDVIVARSLDAETKITDLYNQANDLADGAKTVKLDKLSEALRSRSPSNNATNGMISSIRGFLQEQGALKGFEATGKVDAKTAEAFRQEINSHYDSTTHKGRSIIRDLKDALDEDVLTTVGDDLYDQARASKREYEDNLDRSKVSKYDSRKKNLVRDLMENKIGADEVVDKVIKNKSWRAPDMEQLKTYLNQTDEGVAAWDNMRRDALQDIKDASFKGPEDAAGVGQITRASYARALDRIGEAKLSVLFDESEMQFLNDLRKITKLREPVRGTAQGMGPSAQGMKAATKSLDNITGKFAPMFNGMMDLIKSGYRERQTLTLPSQETPRIRGSLKKLPAAALLAPSTLTER